MDQALLEEKGVRIKFDQPNHATRFRQRCNMLRVLDRRDNLTVYDKNHPMYGRSAYDVLVLRVVDSNVELRKESVDEIDLKVEVIK